MNKITEFYEQSKALTGNCGQILHYLKLGGSFTQSELSIITGFSISTVSRHLSRLQALGLASKNKKLYTLGKGEPNLIPFLKLLDQEEPRALEILQFLKRKPVKKILEAMHAGKETFADLVQFSNCKLPNLSVFLTKLQDWGIVVTETLPKKGAPKRALLTGKAKLIINFLNQS